MIESLIAGLDARNIKPIPKVMAVRITPATAKWLLTFNTRNRPVTNSTLELYKGAMERGEWMFNGRTIVFSTEGVLLDGQHTLIACVQSGIAIEEAFIVVGASPESQMTMDAGKKRTFAEQLALNGESYFKNIQTITRSVWNWDRIGILAAQNMPTQPTIQQLFSTLKDHPEIRASAKFAANNRTVLLSEGIVGTLHYGFSFMSNDRLNADVFFQKLIDGSDLSRRDQTSSILLLRDRLTREANQPRGAAKMATYPKYAYVTIAFNAWMKGEVIYQLKWVTGGAKAQPFPQIWSPF